MAKHRKKESIARSHPGEAAAAETMIRLKRIDAVASVLKVLIRYGCTAVGLYFVLLMIRAVAGKNTNANIVVALAADLLSKDRVVYILAIASNVFAWGLALRWRRLWQDTVEKLGEMRQKYETVLDPARSSSKLLPRGDDTPERLNP